MMFVSMDELLAPFTPTIALNVAERECEFVSQCMEIDDPNAPLTGTHLTVLIVSVGASIPLNTLLVR